MSNIICTCVTTGNSAQVVTADPNCPRHRTSKTVTRLQAIKARTDIGHDGRDIAWLINEVERLTAIVRGLMGPTKRAGYDCPRCHAQIVFGDSICQVTKEQHAAPVETDNPSLQEALAEWDRWRPGHRPIEVLFAEVLTHRAKALEGLIAAARVSVGSPEEPLCRHCTAGIPRTADGFHKVSLGTYQVCTATALKASAPHLDTCGLKYGSSKCSCSAENGTKEPQP